jgi:hypothetical protein
MTKIPNDKRLPRWISENVPTEIVTSTLFRFKITLATTIVTTVEEDGERVEKRVPRTIVVDLLQDLDLDQDIVEQQMEDLPAQYAFWSSVYSEARLVVAQAERILKARRGAVTDLIYNKCVESKVKIPSEQVTRIVENDPELIKADENLSRAQMRCGKMFGMMEALKMKAELAKSLGGFKRAEKQLHGS